MVEQQLGKPVRLSRAERLTLAVISAKLKAPSRHSLKRLRDTIRLVQPETVFKWHRELVRRKVSEKTIATIMERHGIPPAPERGSSPSWRHLMTHYKDQLLICDFFTVDTLFLQTIYVLFFIELGSRRGHFAGCTTNSNAAWVTQQARQMVWDLEGRDPIIRFLIHDNDTKFTQAFDTGFRSEAINVIYTPCRAPNASAFAERWVRTAREECLDKLLGINQAHLRQVMRGEFIAYHNTQRRRSSSVSQCARRPYSRLLSRGSVGSNLPLDQGFWPYAIDLGVT